MVTNQQVRKLMDEIEQGASIGVASARAGMDRKTGRKYAEMGKMPTPGSDSSPSSTLL